MKNKLFDNYVKANLENLRPDVPAHIWENIAAENSRRKPVGFWSSLSSGKIAAGLLLAVLGGGSIYLLANKKGGNTPTANERWGNAETQKSNTAKADRLWENAAQNPADNADGSTGKNNESIPEMPGNNNADANNTNFSKRRLQTAARINMSVDPGAASSVSSATDVEDPQNSLHGYGSFTATTLGLKTRFNPSLIMPLFPKDRSIPCPKAEQDAAGNKKYIEVYAGPDYAFTRFSAGGASSYMQQRKNSTHILFAYSAGVRYTKVFGSGLSMRTGLNYSQINEAFKLLKGHVTQNVYLTNDRGDTTGTYSVTGTQYKQATNKYRTIDIPITAGYEFGNGRLHTNINAGAVVNVVSKQSGFVVDEAGNAVDLGSKQASVYRYKTNMGVSLTGGISVYYKLNENLHILAEPYVRYSLSPATQNALSVSQKYHAAGLRIGFRADL